MKVGNKCWYWGYEGECSVSCSFPRGNWSPIMPMRQHLWSICEGVSELGVLQFVICIFAKPESWVHNTSGRGRKEGYCHKISQRYEGSLILSKVPGLEILRYGLAKKFIHVCCSILWKTSKELFGQFFSDPVFWTKPQGTHLFCPLRNQKRFWVATSSLLPGALLWSLWVLQEQKNFTSREDL